MKRALISILAGATMLAAPAAFAASTPLAPGGAAGVQKAQEFDQGTWLAVAGGALVVAGLVVVLSNNGNGTPGTLTSCTPTQTGASCPVTPPVTTTSTSTSTSTGTSP